MSSRFTIDIEIFIAVSEQMFPQTVIQYEVLIIYIILTVNIDELIELKYVLMYFKCFRCQIFQSLQIH